MHINITVENTTTTIFDTMSILKDNQKLDHSCFSHMLLSIATFSSVSAQNPRAHKLHFTNQLHLLSVGRIDEMFPIIPIFPDRTRYDFYDYNHYDDHLTTSIQDNWANW